LSPGAFGEASGYQQILYTVRISEAYAAWPQTQNGAGSALYTDREWLTPTFGMIPVFYIVVSQRITLLWPPGDSSVFNFA
jgi:hypothetical protein